MQVSTEYTTGIYGGQRETIDRRTASSAEGRVVTTMMTDLLVLHRKADSEMAKWYFGATIENNKPDGPLHYSAARRGVVASEVSDIILPPVLCNVGFESVVVVVVVVVMMVMVRANLRCFR